MIDLPQSGRRLVILFAGGFILMMAGMAVRPSFWNIAIAIGGAMVGVAMFLLVIMPDMVRRINAQLRREGDD